VSETNALHKTMTDFAVTGMTCNNCLKKVQTTLRAIVPDIEVTLTPPLARTQSGITAGALNDALAKVGKYRLSEVDQAQSPQNTLQKWFQTYYPLLLVMGLITVVPLATGTFMGWMMGFMAGFYIVFGAFKLLDVPAFARSYAQYDIIARRLPAWGYVYPFIELALGFGFLFWLNMNLLSWAALILSLIGAVGVIQATLSKQIIQCACLGTVFKLPMSVVTIVENLGMAAMAAFMLWGM
jgi:copper chaperone CopZ